MVCRIVSSTAVIFLTMICSSKSDAQAPDTLWTRTFGGEANDVGRSICFAVDGGYVVAGHTESFGSPQGNAYLFKVGVDGDLAWQRNFGANHYYYARSVRPTSDRGYIITGKAEDEGFFGNVYLLKTDSLGYEVWRQSYEGLHGVSVIENSSGNFVVVGGFLGDLADCLMFCTDPDGNELWWRSYDIDLNDYAHDLVQTEDGGYVLTGCTGAGSLGSSWDLFIMKTDSTGEMSWIKRYGVRPLYFDEIGYSIRHTTDGGFIVGATTTPNGDGYGDYWLVKTDASGDTAWTRTFGGWGSDYGYSALQTIDGGYVIAGTGRSFGGGADVFIVKTDSVGDTLWTKVIGGYDSDIATQIIETKCGGLVIVGDTYANSHGAKDAYVVKLKCPSTGTVENDTPPVPSDFTLLQNYPNPFNDATQIRFNLASPQYLTLTLYAPTGRRISVLADGYFEAGEHKVVFEAGDLASGQYFYQARSANSSKTRSMILIK